MLVSWGHVTLYTPSEIAPALKHYIMASSLVRSQSRVSGPFYVEHGPLNVRKSYAAYVPS